MHQKRNAGYQKNIYSAALFALAMLVLIVSCPLKRFLINNNVSQTSTPLKSNQTTSQQNFSISYSSNPICCAAKNETAILQADKAQHKKVGAPVFTLNIFNHTGYYIHSFLDGIKAGYTLTPGSCYSSLPLFLQHRSLLV